MKPSMKPYRHPKWNPEDTLSDPFDETPKNTQMNVWNTDKKS